MVRWRPVHSLHGHAWTPSFPFGSFPRISWCFSSLGFFARSTCCTLRWMRCVAFRHTEWVWDHVRASHSSLDLGHRLPLRAMDERKPLVQREIQDESKGRIRCVEERSWRIESEEGSNPSRPRPGGREWCMAKPKDDVPIVFVTYRQRLTMCLSITLPKPSEPSRFQCLSPLPCSCPLCLS